ncbi:MAG: hypothetical protein ACUVXF_01150 [Desulfobaccales bacterium]
MPEMREVASATIVVVSVLLLFLGVAIFSPDILHHPTSSDTSPRAPLSRAY